MSDATLHRLPDQALIDAQIDALFQELHGFLLTKQAGHCQRIDYLPRPVLEGLTRRLAEDPELVRRKMVCRMVTDRPIATEDKGWQVTGSGAVALREHATVGEIHLFTALFPAGVRLAEEDSLNIATFKTDDADSFDIRRCLERALQGRVNQLPGAEKSLLATILALEPIKSRPVVDRLRWTLAVLNQRDQTGQPASWETVGAFLHELNLIPDFDLSGDYLGEQITRNARCISVLTDGERTLGQSLAHLTGEIGVDDPKLIQELDIWLSGKDLLKPRQWLPDIAHDPVVREKLSFDVWRFAAPVRGVTIDLKPLQDPNKPEKISKGLEVKQGTLCNDGKKPVQIRWTTEPKKPEDLAGYRISVVRQTEDGGEVEVTTPQTINARRKSFMTPMAGNNLDDDEKCVVCIRIQGLSKTGTPIANASDETEEFWIENGTEISTPPPARTAKLRHRDELRFRAVHRTGKKVEIRNQDWDLKRNHIFSIRLSTQERGDLVLNPVLKSVERAILENPNTLGMLTADLVSKRKAEVADFKPFPFPPSLDPEVNVFFQARSAFFAAVRDLHNGTGVVEIADLHALETEVKAYIESYMGLLRRFSMRVSGSSGQSAINTTLHDLASILRIDTITLRVGPVESPMEVALLAPTHPLRVLWLFQYETFVRLWIDAMIGKSPDQIERMIAEDSIDKLVNLNLPHALSWSQGQAFLNTDNIDLYWGVFPDTRLPDMRTAVATTLRVLGATQRQAVITTVTPRQIADKLERYLAHHPYVETFRINVVNPGDGALILEAMMELLGKELYQDLNFDLTFFSAPGTRPHRIGQALDDFMAQISDQDWTSGVNLSEVAERLMQPNANPLFPKLVYAKHSVSALLEDDQSRFDAHVTFVLDYFGTTVATRAHQGPMGSATIHNLIVEYLTDYSAGTTSATWSRMVVPHQCPDLAADDVTRRLFFCHAQLNHLTASCLDWDNSTGKNISVQLELSDAQGKNHLKLLRRVHQASDWVLTIDRNFGIEYYDDPDHGPAASASGGYLIDYSPEFLDAVSHRLIISTAHQQEIASILHKGFANLLNTENGISSFTVATVLQVLKSVSGKLPLKLINNPSQAQEVIGLALTRLALEQAGRLRGRVLIPVDSHIDLFYQTPRELDNQELTLKRTDLMLVELQGRHLHVALIEVKNRAHSTPQEQIDLHEAIWDKNKNTEAHFRAHFLGQGAIQRFDAAIKNKQLANILAFYFERASRYGLFASGDDQGPNLESFREGLRAVEAGSSEVSFSHQGFIINGSALHRQETKTVHGNDITTIGRAGVRELLRLVMDEDQDEEPVPDKGEPGPVPEEPEEGMPDEREEVAVPESEEALPETSAGVSNEPQPETVPADGEPTDSTKPEAQKPPSPRPAGSGQLDILLGRNEVTGESMRWNPYTTTPRRLTNQHILIVGKSGSGKSETTKAVIWELARRNVPSIIFDFQGEYASGQFFDAVQPQVFNVMDGLPVNPFELPQDPLTGKKKSFVEMIFGLADTLNSVFRGSGDIQLGILREAIEECYVQQGFTRDPATWDNQPPTLDMLEAVLKHFADERGGQVRNLLVRLQPLFKSGIFHPDAHTFEFDKLFDRTTVLLMTSGIKDLMVAASRFMLEKIYAAMLTAGVSKQVKVMVVVDEAHKLCGDETITSLIKEARKYGLGLILSSQETRDFHPSVFLNTGTLVSLALEDADATVMAKQLGLTEKTDQKRAKEMILNQGSGQALIRSQHFLPYKQMQIKSFDERIEEGD
ncbi:MAG: type IV secretion system DNA-binding domain-containing protein [Magnetococcales bacterium]|nr:type IV secretion system DNA-binding domain-containing protein [Magnetococcales bacterium]MBF0151936.1 type IV secretion system DNA-binding domain-containing protein [Magnetococcales bacterium]